MCTHIYEINFSIVQASSLLIGQKVNSKKEFSLILKSKNAIIWISGEVS